MYPVGPPPMIFVPATRYGVPLMLVRCQNRWYSKESPFLSGCFRFTCLCSDSGTSCLVNASRSEEPTTGFPSWESTSSTW